MKKEDLLVLGLSEEQAKKVLVAVEDYVPKTRLTEAEQERDGLKATVAERDKQLDELKASSGDSAALRRQIGVLQKQNVEQQRAHEAELARLRLDNAIDAAVIAAGARNAKAVKALLDTSVMKLGEDGKVSGLEDALKAVQKSDAYLFREREPAPAQFRGFQPGASGGVKPGAGADTANMTYSEMVAYLEVNPGAKI